MSELNAHLEAMAIGRVEVALAGIGASHAPPIDWTNQLLAAIARAASEPATAPIDPPSRDGASPSPPISVTIGPSAASGQLIGSRAPRLKARVAAERPRWRSWLEGGLLVAAAAVAVVIAIGRTPSPADDLALDVTWAHGGPPVRGGTAHIGDVAQAVAAGGGHYRAIWVYRGERELAFACPAAGQMAPACAQGGEQLAAGVPLPEAGLYTFVALSSDAPLPVPRGSFDDDLAATAKAGAAVKRWQLRVE